MFKVIIYDNLRQELFYCFKLKFSDGVLHILTEHLFFYASCTNVFVCYGMSHGFRVR